MKTYEYMFRIKKSIEYDPELEELYECPVCGTVRTVPKYINSLFCDDMLCHNYGAHCPRLVHIDKRKI